MLPSSSRCRGSNRNDLELLRRLFLIFMSQRLTLKNRALARSRLTRIQENLFFLQGAASSPHHGMCECGEEKRIFQQIARKMTLSRKEDQGEIRRCLSENLTAPQLRRRTECRHEADYYNDHDLTNSRSSGIPLDCIFDEWTMIALFFALVSGRRHVSSRRTSWFLIIDKALIE